MSGADAGAKKATSGVFENYFETTYPPLPLPAIWRIIYHEAVRGNHILWDQSEIETIDKTIKSPDLKLSQEDTLSITKFMAGFFSSGDFRDLKRMIKDLPDHQKSIAFLLYSRAIKVWQKWLKTNLH